MGFGSGEEVSPDVIRYYRGLDPGNLERIRSAGVSDQRVALINQILAEQQGAPQISEKELVATYSKDTSQVGVKDFKGKQASQPYSYTLDPTGRLEQARRAMIAQGTYKGTTSTIITPSTRRSYPSLRFTFNTLGSYDVKSSIYTNKQGIKQSMTLANALKRRVPINYRQLQRIKRIPGIKPLTIKQKLISSNINLINMIGKHSTKRTAKKDLTKINKERDKIYEDLNKLYNKYKGQLSESQFTNYEKELSLITTRYKSYSEAKSKILKNIPEKEKRATIEYLPSGEKALVLDKKDLSLSNRINEAMERNIIKTQGGKGGLKTELALGGLVLGGLAVDFAKGTIQLPSTIVSLIKNPEQLAEVPIALGEYAKSTGKLLRISPTAGLARIGGEYFLWTRGGAGALKLVGKIKRPIAQKMSDLFKRTESTPLGIKKLKKVKGVGEIEIIPRSGTYLKVKPLKAVLEADIKKQLVKNPKLAPVTKIEKRVLQIVKKRGDIVSGSYAQESLLKKAFTTKHKDLDILTRNRESLIKQLRRQLGKKAKFKIKKNAVTLYYNGKEIADIVPYKKGEEKFAKKFGAIKVNGLKLIRPEARLASKVKQFGKIPVGKISKKSKKVLRDIENIYGRKIDLKRPAIRGAFGYSAKQQAKYIGKKVILTTAQQDLFKAVKGIFKPKEFRLKKFLYATPSELKKGTAQVRVSRLGLGEAEEASFLELLKGQASLRAGKPAIYVLPKEKIFKAPKKVLSKERAIKTKGFIVPNFSSELEVVLGKGFIIKQGKKLASRRIEGKSVPIYELQKIKIPNNLKKEINNIRNLNSRLNKLKPKRRISSARLKNISKNKKNLIRKIDNKELSLNKKLKRLTGFDYFSPKSKRLKVYPVGKKITTLATRAGKVSRYIPRRKISRIQRVSKIYKPSNIRYTLRGTPYVITKYGARFISPKYISSKPSRISKPYRTYIPSRPVGIYKRQPITPPIRTKRGKKVLVSKKISGRVPVFNVYGKSGKRFVKLNKKPLIRNDALSRGTFAVDNTTAKTFIIKPAGKMKSPGALRKSERNYFNRAGYKLREYKVKKGRKFALKNKYLEKRRFGIDTRGEKSGLSIAKFLEQQRKGKPIKRISMARTVIHKRKISPTQRKVLIQRLKKARAVRMRNLRRR